MEPERMEVLRLVQEGKISASEAERLLAAMEEVDGQETSVIVAEAQEAPGHAATEELPVRRRPYWLYVTAFGLGWSLIGASLTIWLQNTLWLILVIPFLLIGLLITAIGIWSRDSAWLSVQITDLKTGRSKVGLSFPVPLTLAAWSVRMARPFVPQFRDTAVDEVILALREGTMKEGALLVDVIDDEDGEHVQVRIG